MGRFFRSSLRTGRIYRSSNYGQFTQSMSPNYKNQWLADGDIVPVNHQIPQLSARISPQGRPRFPDLPKDALDSWIRT